MRRNQNNNMDSGTCDSEVAPARRRCITAEWVRFTCVLAAVFLYLAGRLALSGCLLVIAGLISALFGLPFALLIALIGAAPIAVASGYPAAVGAVGLFICIVGLVDGMELARLRRERGELLRTASGRRQFFALLNERDVAHKLCRWFGGLISKRRSRRRTSDHG